MFEVVGALGAGLCLIFLRKLFMPSGLLVLILAAQTFAYSLMINPDQVEFVKDAVIFGVKVNAFCEGALFTTLGVFIHEEYGTE